MKILIVGSGGREHALGEKIKSSDRKLYFAPGNAGTSEIGENIDIEATDIEKLVEFAKEEEIDYTIVGPEDPLCMGLVDRFQENDLKVFGVNKKASKFESSKTYCKNFLEKYKIKTPAYLKSEDKEEILAYGEKLIKEKGKLVLKRDGLAGGKGVYIIDKLSEFREKVSEILAMDKFLIIEEFIDGFEMSLLSLTDSSTIIPLPTAKDHKKIYDREIGPNTGGMGTYAPNVEAEAFKEKISEDILPKILEGFGKENIDYRGVLFIGFMINESGIYVLEFNVRFGDPETQVVLELIDNDILDLLMKTSSKKLDQVKLKINDKKAVSLVLASEGYPLSYEVSKEITFDEGIKSKIIHAGTKKEEGKILTAGGRVLNILSASDSFDEAIAKVYEDSEKIHFDGKYYRKDIGPSVKRVYVKKKDAYDFESKNLRKKSKIL